MSTIERGASETAIWLTDHHDVYCTCHLRGNVCQCATSIAGRSYCAVLQTMSLFDKQCTCVEVKAATCNNAVVQLHSMELLMWIHYRQAFRLDSKV